MKQTFIKLNAFLKGVVLVARPHVWLGFFRQPFLFISNLLSLSRWIAAQPRQGSFNDFFSPARNYQKRFELHRYVQEQHKLNEQAIDYLEFGVCAGHSFRWWLEANQHPGSRFYGFDTFEGLPEDWGFFQKGDMHADIPTVNDARALFVKGLFQEAVPPFLKEHNLHNGKRKVIHFDADLYSSTLFALSVMAPYLRPGDILLFDEFNVPNHEYYAYKCFTEAFYVKTKLVGAVDNYYQVAMVVEDNPMNR